VAGLGGISAGGTTGVQQEDEAENEDAERVAAERSATSRHTKGSSPWESHRNAANGLAVRIAD
jgi:hypothetical protein